MSFVYTNCCVKATEDLNRSMFQCNEIIIPHLAIKMELVPKVFPSNRLERSEPASNLETMMAVLKGAGTSSDDADQSQPQSSKR